MCDGAAPAVAAGTGWTRRRVLAAAGTLGAGALVPRRPATAQVGNLEVLARSAWAGDDAPAGPVPDEPDVRFLLVHHTVNRNDYGADHVVGLLRDIHRLHTGPDRAWPDIAYNFVVDRFGRAWETRAGSLDRPVAGDATGGNQGFDQKCAFLGDHRSEAPSPEATATMAALLAFLADRSSIDTAPGATTSFESRGSNLHPAGTVVTTPTITGHRTMSRTACPGDAGFALVRDRLPADVTARRRPSSADPAPSTAPSTPDPSSTTAPTGTPTTAAPTTAPPGPPTTTGGGVAASPTPDAEPVPWPLVGAAGGAGAVVLGGLLVLRSRRGR